MKPKDLKKIRKTLEKELEPKRFEHTLGVEYTAASLAMRYDVSIEDALVAGLLHDCAKCISGEKLIDICEKQHIDINNVERKNPSLLHTKVGEYLAQEIYDIHDSDILNAIRYHTTGRPGMSILEKIVFIADYIEPGRKQAPNLEEIRKLAFTDLDNALIRILEDTLAYLKDSEDEVDPMTRKTYEYYMQNNQ